MKSLVTGGAGFIGSNLVDLLLSEGHEVVCVDNESSESHENFYWNSECENHKVDICDFDSMLPLFRSVDYVFHMAAEARIMPTIINPTKAVHTNMYGTAVVLQCARNNNVKRLMYSSTSSAYGNNSIPNVETMKSDCLNPYSVSKAGGEQICTMYTKLFGLKTIIFRYFNVYGDRQPIKGQYAPVIGIFNRQKRNGEPLTIVGDGTQRRDFVNVKDVAKANFLAATVDIKDEFFGTVFNVGTGINYSVLDIANMISDKQKFIEQRPGEMKETLADISKIKGVLGWNPTINLRDYIGSLS